QLKGSIDESYRLVCLTRLRDKRKKRVFAIFTLVIMLLGALSVARIQTVSATKTPFSTHIVFIIMENNPLSGITSTTAPYMHSLASTTPTLPIMSAQLAVLGHRVYQTTSD